MTESVPVYFQKHFRENFNADDYYDYVSDGCRGGSRGRVQGLRTPPPPPEMTCGFLIQLVFCKKKTMWFIGVEVEQETSAPPPKKILDPPLGCIYYGQPGCCKKAELIKLAAKAINPIILSFINKAIDNIKSRIGENLRDKCYTFDSYFCDYHGRDISNLEGKTIFIEEYSMTPK